MKQLTSTTGSVSDRCNAVQSENDRRNDGHFGQLKGDGRLTLTWMKPWNVTEVTLENVVQIAVLRWGRNGILQCLD